MKITIIIIVIISVFLSIDFFSYKAINSAFNEILLTNLIAKIIFLSTSGIIVLLISIGLFRLGSTPDAFKPNLFYSAFAIIVLFYVPKINIDIFYLFEKISLLIFKKNIFKLYRNGNISNIFFIYFTRYYNK